MPSTTWGNMAAVRAAAENLTDAIKTRVAAVNRAQRGGVAIDDLQRERLIRSAVTGEDDARSLLMSIYTEEVPDKVREFAAGVPGMRTGEVFPRLIGIIGNPRLATPYTWDTSGEKRVLVPDGDPYERTLRQLWSWCGCGDAQRRPRSGMSQAELMACGRRTTVRPLLYTFSSYLSRSGRIITKETSRKIGQPVSQEVADSKYFKILEDAKEHGLHNVHQDTCRNHKRPPMKPNGCGTVAHPEWGEPGSPWRPAHAEAHAHRIVAKEFLRDLWVISENV